MKGPNHKLIQKAIKGNKKAFEQLIMKHHEQMYRTAFLYVRNKEDALDIVQEATYQALVSIHTLKNPEYFMTWFTKIIIRCSGQVIEKRKMLCR
ncbi:sigma factor [Bacillus sp. V59.32b]|uniref:sigma factor n=1 Tax=Bacillus sp. V59.32b TaxID=1758642 RepID=UPI0026BC7DD2